MTKIRPCFTISRTTPHVVVIFICYPPLNDTPCWNASLMCVLLLWGRIHPQSVRCIWSKMINIPQSFTNIPQCDILVENENMLVSTKSKYCDLFSSDITKQFEITAIYEKLFKKRKEILKKKSSWWWPKWSGLSWYVYSVICDVISFILGGINYYYYYYV